MAVTPATPGGVCVAQSGAGSTLPLWMQFPNHRHNRGGDGDSPHTPPHRTSSGSALNLLPRLLSHLSFFSRFQSRWSLTAGMSPSRQRHCRSARARNEESRRSSARTRQHMGCTHGQPHTRRLRHRSCIICRCFCTETMPFLPTFARLRRGREGHGCRPKPWDEFRCFLPVRVPELAHSRRLSSCI